MMSKPIELLLFTATIIVVIICSTVVQGQLRAPSECNPTSLLDVVIIGAGISGISAAVELYNNKKVHNITILESRSRIGGRINTIRHNDSTYEDYGAQWVHGNKRHPLMALISQYNLFVPDRLKPSEDASWYNLNGVEISSRVADSVDEAFERFKDQVDGKSSVTVGNQIRRSFDNWLRRNSGNSELKQAVFEWLYNFENTENSEDLSRVSAEEFDAYQDVPGDQEALVKNGWLSVIERITTGMPMDSIVTLGAVVRRIKYDATCPGDNTRRVAVFLNDGRVIVGKTAIVTLPLGVLKSGQVTFEPPLPSNKQSAISKLGYGCMVKLFLHFRRSWWGADGYVNALFVRSVPDNITVRQSAYSPNSNESQWYRQLVGFNAAYGNNLILQGWLTGDWARLVERLPLDEVTSVVNQILTRAFSQDYRNFELPYKIARTEWCYDQFTQGAYSYMAVGAHATDFEALAEPTPAEDPNVFFAGEATSDSQWSSVHGAWSTGIRAAGEAFDELN